MPAIVIRGLILKGRACMQDIVVVGDNQITRFHLKGQSQFVADDIHEIKYLDLCRGQFGHILPALSQIDVFALIEDVE